MGHEFKVAESEVTHWKRTRLDFVMFGMSCVSYSCLIHGNSQQRTFFQYIELYVLKLLLIKICKKYSFFILEYNI